MQHQKNKMGTAQVPPLWLFFSVNGTTQWHAGFNSSTWKIQVNKSLEYSVWKANKWTYNEMIQQGTFAKSLMRWNNIFPMFYTAPGKTNGSEKPKKSIKEGCTRFEHRSM